MKKILATLLIIIISIQVLADWRMFFNVTHKNDQFGVAIGTRDIVFLSDSSAWYKITHILNKTDSMATAFRLGYAVKISGGSGGSSSVKIDSLAFYWNPLLNYIAPRHLDDSLMLNRTVRFNNGIGSIGAFSTDRTKYNSIDLYTFSGGITSLWSKYNNFQMSYIMYASGLSQSMDFANLSNPSDETQNGSIYFYPDHISALAADKLSIGTSLLPLKHVYTNKLSVKNLANGSSGDSLLTTAGNEVKKIASSTFATTGQVAAKQDSTANPWIITDGVAKLRYYPDVYFDPPGGEFVMPGVIYDNGGSSTDWNKVTSKQDSTANPWIYSGGNTIQRGTGNLGIGTTSPTTKLDVNGEIAASNFSNILYVGTNRTYSTIQAAVNAASNGTVIKVGNGTYTEVVTITGKSNITIEGEVQPKYSGSYTAGTISGGVILNGNIFIYNGYSVTIRNIGINITHANPYGVFIGGSSGTVKNCIIENVIVKGTLDGSEHGITAESDGATIVSGTTIRNCQVYRTAFGFIVKSQNVMIDNCFAGKQSSFGFVVCSDNIQGASTVSYAKNVILNGCISDSASITGIIGYTKDFYSTAATNLSGYELENYQINGCTVLNSANIGVGIGIYSALTFPALDGSTGQRIVKNVSINGGFIKASTYQALYMLAADVVKIYAINLSGNGTNYLASANATNVTYPEGAADLLVTGKIGVGTTAPSYDIQSETSLSSIASIRTNTLGTGSGGRFYAYAKAQPTAANQRLGQFIYGSRGGAEKIQQGAEIDAYSEGAWTDAVSYPAYILFKTTPSGSTTPTTAMTITSAGSVGIGVTAPTTTLDVNGVITATGGSSTTWNSKLTSTLTSANVFVGNGSNVATGVALSGDATITNAGVVSVDKTRLNVRNETGSSIATTKAVYTTGYNNYPLILLADNTDEAKHNVIGVTVGSIANSANGYIATSGQCDAETNAWTVGTELYLSTSGSLTSTEPTSGDVQHVGIVTVQGNYPAGKLLIYSKPEGNIVAAGSAQNITLRVGDAVGANKVSIKNYSNTEVAGINSYGSYTGVDVDVTGNIDADSTISPGIVAVGNTGTAVTCYLRRGNTQTLTRNGNCTVTLQGGVSGTTYTLVFTHEASTTAYTVAFSPTVKWAGGTALTFTNTSGAVDIVVLKNVGGTYYASGGADFK